MSGAFVCYVIIMDDNTFKEGQELTAIYLSDETNCIVGKGVERITVVYEYGERAGVPWFAVWNNGRIESKWNAAKVEGVRCT